MNDWTVDDVNPGDKLRVKDFLGDWFDATAASRIEGTHLDGRKIHDFPVIWIDMVGYDGEMHRVPWPLAQIARPT